VFSRSDAPPAAVQNRRLLALWLTAAAVLAWVPGGYGRFVWAKVLLVVVAALVGASVPRDGRLPRSLVVGLGIGALLFTVAALSGETPVPSLVGRFPRYEGLPVLGAYVAAAWLGARIGGRGPARAVQLAHALAAAALALGAFALLDLAGGSPLGASTLERNGSVLGNATDQGLVAAMMALVVAGALEIRRDGLLLAGLAGALVTVAVSGSRIALALTAVGLLVQAVRRRTLRRPLLLALAGLAVVVVSVPDTRDRMLSWRSGRGRLEQWQLTADLVRDHPWLGVGPSRYVDAVGVYETPQFVAFTGPRTLADSPHDVLLQAAVAGGLPLLACFVVLAVLVVRRSIAVVAEHPEAWGVLTAVAAYGLAVLANPTAPGPTCLAAFLVGVLVAEPAPAPEPAWPRRATAAGLVAAVVAMTACLVAEVQLGQGVAEAHDGDVDAAQSSFDAAHRWRPWDPDVSLVAAEASVTGDPDGARQRALDALDATPDSFEALVTLGLAELALGDTADGHRHLDRAALLFPQRPVAR